MEINYCCTSVLLYLLASYRWLIRWIISALIFVWSEVVIDPYVRAAGLFSQMVSEMGGYFSRIYASFFVLLLHCLVILSTIPIWAVIDQKFKGLLGNVECLRKLCENSPIVFLVHLAFSHSRAQNRVSVLGFWYQEWCGLPIVAAESRALVLEILTWKKMLCWNAYPCGDSRVVFFQCL